MRLIPLVLIGLCSFTATTPAAEVRPTEADTILILGDSITHAGHYVVDLELALRAATPPAATPNLINLGLPSETCCGLSEPDHPFPRPNVHTRLEQALRKTSPDLVICCYGMNDGIYHPFSEERFAIYKAGVRKLVQKVHAADTQIILLTPPPFDPQPLQNQPGKLLPAGSKIFGWKGVADTYDDVIQAYAEWIMSNEVGADQVIDIHTPMIEYLNRKRKSEPDYVFANDGVHLNAAGHAVMAAAILDKWKLKLPAEESAEARKIVRSRERLLHDAWLSEVGHERPGMKDGLPINQALSKAAELDKTLQQFDLKLAQPNPSQ